MDIEFIYTYDLMPQEMANYEDIDRSVIKDRESLFEFATKDMDYDEILSLVKISCMVSNAVDIEPPQWFIQSNGKLWISNGKLD